VYSLSTDTTHYYNKPLQWGIKVGKFYIFRLLLEIRIIYIYITTNKVDLQVKEKPFVHEVHLLPSQVFESFVKF
jgi:hypothetical protein